MWTRMPTHRKQGNTNTATSQDAWLAAEQSFLLRTEVWGKKQEARRHITLLMVSRRWKDGFRLCICSELCSPLSWAKPCRVAFTSTRQGELEPCRAKGVRQHPIRWLHISSHPHPCLGGMYKSAGERQKARHRTAIIEQGEHSLSPSPKG